MKEKALLNQIVLTMILQTIDQIKVDIIEMTLYRILNGTIATDILDSNLHQIKTFGCLAIINANEVLKCLEGPANTVSPGAKPPSTEPDRATFNIGTSVVTISFSVKNLDSERTSV